MVRDEKLAAAVAEQIKAAYAALDHSAYLVRQDGDKDEVTPYVNTVGTICCDIIFKLMEPLYESHPHLKPEGWE
ncbi:hypothetical protein [Granulicella aggregans]|uniref:hypothetical protein n=1 Tax=Granulicella aggregans TaxID=474949 RepID=UPI0021E025F1|nr:hypothetical protein [Granulicella aggregans]